MRATNPKMATKPQIEYINFLLDRLEEDGGTIADVLVDLNPDYGVGEGLDDWLRRQTAEEASKIIDYLKIL